MRPGTQLRILPVLSAVAVLLAGTIILFSGGAGAHEKSKAQIGSDAGCGMTGETRGQADAMAGMRLSEVKMDPVRGRKLFAAKGCVACHSINGVGGHDAAPLDAHTMDRMMNPFEFAAKMWAMAPYMIAAQEEELGSQILFTGDELADIIAFVHSDEEQHHFSEADIPPEIEPLMHHSHTAPGGGAMEHGEEIGHTHADGEQHEQSN